MSRIGPDDHEHRFNTPGRSHSDWLALKELWEKCPSVHERGFSTVTFHAYAEPRTQLSVEGRRLSERIVQLFDSLGYDVTPRPDRHFVRREVPALQGPGDSTFSSGLELVDAGEIPIVEVVLERKEPALLMATGDGKGEKKQKARRPVRQQTYVRCFQCDYEFRPSSRTMKRASIVAGTGVGGALSGVMAGASVGAGYGLAGGGTAMAATVPLGVIGGLVVGTTLAIGGNVGAKWALAKVSCPNCNSTFRIKGI